MNTDATRLRASAVRGNGISTRTIARWLQVSVADIHAAAGCRREAECRGPGCRVGQL